MVQGSGSVNFSKLDPQSLVGKTVQARVLGYTWKDASGNYQRSFGRNNQPVPTIGRPNNRERATGPPPRKENKAARGGPVKSSPESTTCLLRSLGIKRK